MKSGQEAMAVPACDAKIAALVEQYVRTGTLQQANDIMRDERFIAMREFTKIYGVGEYPTLRAH